jgi:hypothetical protein
MIIMWEIVMIFKMSYSVFVLFTGIEPTQAPPFIPHLRGGSLLAGKDKKTGRTITGPAIFSMPLFIF